METRATLRVLIVGLGFLLMSGAPARSTGARARTAHSAHTPARVQAQIVNGVLTSAYPAAGALLVGGDPHTPLSTACTGTLIGCDTVLTAAHCVCPEDAQTGAACLAAGVTDPAALSVFFQHAGVFGVDSVAINPDYEFGSASDVAVLKLTNPVSGIAPAPLNVRGTPLPGTTGTIVGFGVSTDNGEDSGLKRVGTVTTAVCAHPIPNSTHVCWNFVAPLGTPGQNSNTCDGDSGGPLFVAAGSETAVAGVTSGRNPGCTTGSVNWDADVFYDRAWIESQAATDMSSRCGDTAQAGAPGTQINSTSGDLGTSAADATFSVSVPAGTTLLRVALNGSDSDAAGTANEFDLYVKADKQPTISDYDCRDIRSGPYGFCEFSAPRPTTWYALVTRVHGAGAYQLTATSFGAAPLVCDGDCNGDAAVTVDELVKGVNVALGILRLDECRSFDANGDGAITVDELLRAVSNALTGCPTT